MDLFWHLRPARIRSISLKPCIPPVLTIGIPLAK
jgi:hypothetical protein